jgi:hypothetical protein
MPDDEELEPEPNPDNIRMGRWALPIKTALKVVLFVALIQIGITITLWNDYSLIQHNQAAIQREETANQAVARASDCWDQVLLVALRDHLTPTGRTALIVEANRCGQLTAAENQQTGVTKK